VPPQIIDSRVMVPIRAISEALGCQVTWDFSSRSVVIDTANVTAPSNTPSTLNQQTINQMSAGDGEIGQLLGQASPQVICPQLHQDNQGLAIQNGYVTQQLKKIMQNAINSGE
jgi:hypothetical protein